MLVLKLLSVTVKARRSEGTPGKVGAGIGLGAILGLTPLLSLHNLLVVALIFLLNVSLPGAALGWAIATPLGFALDPVFDALGRWLLLGVPALTPLWTALANAPVVPLTNFNNSVVLGSLVASLVLFTPIYVGSRWGLRRYRETLGERVKNSGLYRAITTSRLFGIIRLFRPNA